MEGSVLTEVLLPIALALIMLGMGLTLTWDDFRRVVVLPKAVAIGLIAQILLLPLVGWMLIQIIPMPVGIAAGLMILALCPGGPTASLITFLARGDAALSVTLTATSSLITLVTTPLGLFFALERLGGEGRQVHLPVGQTLAFLLVITIIPVAIGMWIKAKKPDLAVQGETPFKLFGLICLILIIAAAILRERNNLASFFAQAGLAALSLNVVALALGAGLALAFRLSKAQATCIAIDTGNCNGTLSIAVAATILEQPDMAITPAVYSLLMLVLGGVAIFVAPRLGRRVLKTESIGAQSLGDVLAKAVTKFGPSVAMRIPGKDGTTELTYAELGEQVRRASAVYRQLQLQRGDRVAILAENSATWAFADWGAQALGIVTVPIFPTNPKEVAAYIVKDSGAKLVWTGSAEQDRKLADLEGVRIIRLQGPDSLESRLEATEPMAKDHWLAEIASAQPEELATLIYTSGTTGIPKGVMLPHRAFTHVCDAARRGLPFDQNEVFLSFLPMSHVYERVAGQVLPISIGASIAYSRGLAALAGEMQQVKPTVMLCVPRFLEATMDRILDNSKKLPPLDKKLFDLALRQNTKRVRGQFAPMATVLDLLVLANVRDRLGGNFRYFVSGGAALPTHVAEFYLAIGLTILQGYGLTETSGATSINRPGRNKYWTVGEPLDVEIRLAEDGEILVRGDSVMLGYYRLPEATAEAMDADGWFRTGDIGEFEGPNLKITDRKKDLFKLSNGKYVAPQALENRLKESVLIQEAVVFGDGQDLVTALIVPDWERVRLALGLPEAAPAEWVDRKEVRAAIQAEIAAVNQHLAQHEIVKRFTLLASPFTIEGGELTPTLKVKRRVVSERYESVLAEMR
jgi:long-chain acyl-CoA synthetase